MSLVAVVVALVLALVAFKFVKGLIKFGVIALIIVAVIWFFMNGAAH
jgi:hypothetical protein